MVERDRPLAGPGGTGDLADVVILSPTTGATVLVPGELPVRIGVTRTSGLLERVSVTAILFATQTPVADITHVFDPTVEDTMLTLTLVLEGFQTNTQLNLQARARVSGRSASSGEVPVITIHCNDLPPGSCP
jgi:hypothetical protein